MDFHDLMETMTQAACAGDGHGVARCFTEHGVYHDVFYGAFHGRARIAAMIEDYFHRDGEDFRWDIYDPMTDGSIGYARYLFSYSSRLPQASGRRTMFEGVAIVSLADDLIATYREVANVAPALLRLGFAAERVTRICDRQWRQLAERGEAQPHL